MADEIITEEWRSIEGWPYEVSNFGSVRRLHKRGGNGPKGNIIKVQYLAPRHNQAVVHLYSGGHNTRRALLLGRLVCRAFHGEPPTSDHVAAHNDGNPHNNRANNLRWATQSDNLMDKVAHGTHRRGSRAWNAKLTEEMVPIIRSEIAKGTRLSRIAEHLGVSAHSVRNVKHGSAWAWLK